jgi:hypothetical protein
MPSPQHTFFSMAVKIAGTGYAAYGKFFLIFIFNL